MGESYRRYQHIRDTAWRALLRLDAPSLPVRPEALAEKIGVVIADRALAQRQEHTARLLEKAPGGAAASVKVKNQWYIFVSSGLEGSVRRFALAHELGHILLEHPLRPVGRDMWAVTGPDNIGDLSDAAEDDPDCGADMFALRLLAPACVLHEARADSPGAIMTLCGLPPRAANMRAERMELLNRRDAYYESSLERKVRDHFLPVLRGSVAPASAPAKPLILPLPVQQPSPAPSRPYWIAALLGALAAGIAAYLFLR